MHTDLIYFNLKIWVHIDSAQNSSSHLVIFKQLTNFTQIAIIVLKNFEAL